MDQKYVQISQMDAFSSRKGSKTLALRNQSIYAANSITVPRSSQKTALLGVPLSSWSVLILTADTVTLESVPAEN